MSDQLAFPFPGDPLREQLNCLQHLRLERKFAKERYYPGAVTEDIRIECERRVNHFLDRVITLLQQAATKDDLISQTTELEATFRGNDTEEREKVGDYIGKQCESSASVTLKRKERATNGISISVSNPNKRNHTPQRTLPIGTGRAVRC